MAKSNLEKTLSNLPLSVWLSVCLSLRKEKLFQLVEITREKL
jgi:hypothetical protein